jgi:hypothetical protein
MIKHGVWIAFFAASLALTACDLAIPKTLEVRAAPKVPIKNLGKEIDIKGELRDALNGKFKVPGMDSEPKMAFANNTADGNMVYVVSAEVINIKKDELFTAINTVIRSIPVTVNGGSTTIGSALSTAGFTTGVNEGNVGTILGSGNDTLVQTTLNAVLNTNVSKQDLPYNIPDVDIPIPIDSMADILVNFKFTESAGELYIADYAATSKFDEFFGFKFGVNTAGVLQDGAMFKMYDGYANFEWTDESKSFIDYAPKGHGQTIPTNLFVENNLNAKFDIVMKKDATIRQLLECLRDMKLKAEIIAWIPLKFEARSDGAFFKISIEKAFNEGDLFFREEGDEKQDYELEIEYMNVEIVFSIPQFNNMFNGKLVEIGNDKNPAFPPFKRQIKENKLIINFDKETMDTIYDNSLNNPFIPTLKVLFAPGEKLIIPWELVVKDAYIEFGMVGSFDLEGKK